MATLSEVLLAMSEVLGGYDYDVETASAKGARIKITVDDRITARDEIKAALDNNRPKIPYQQRPHRLSSFDSIFIKESATSEVQVYFKGKRGGSGAGAAITKQTESGQAVYAAVAFHLGRAISSADITDANVKAAKDKYDVDENLPNIYKMSDDWVSSCVKGANLLWSNFGSLKNKGVKFHRGSNVVKHIENQFKRVKSKEGVRIDINKWSPADIYVTTNQYDSKCLEEEMTLQGLNQCMMERLQNQTMFGVSLKKITSPTGNINPINVNKDIANTKTFEGWEFSQDSVDCYMLFSDNYKIQFRGFDGAKKLTGFQGEVGKKGSGAKHGKVGLGSLNLILKLHGVGAIPTDYASRVTNGTKRSTVITNVQNGVEQYTNKGTFNKKKYIDYLADKEKAGETNGYLYSKGLAIEVVKLINSIQGKKQQQVCEDFLLYASSQSIIAAPFYKME